MECTVHRLGYVNDDIIQSRATSLQKDTVDCIPWLRWCASPINISLIVIATRPCTNLRKWGSTKQLSLAEAWCHCFTSDIWSFCAHCSMCSCFVFPSVCEGAVCLVQWREPAFGIPRFARVSGLDGDALHCLDLWAPQHMLFTSPAVDPDLLRLLISWCFFRNGSSD